MPASRLETQRGMAARMRVYAGSISWLTLGNWMPRFILEKINRINNGTNPVLSNLLHIEDRLSKW